MSTDTGVRAVVYPALNPTGEPEGFSRGHAAGYAAGLRKAEAELAAHRTALDADAAQRSASADQQLAAALSVLGAAAAALRARTAPVLADADRVLAETALAVAATVVGYELADPEAGAEAALRRALSAADAERVVEVRLNPADADLVAAPEGVRVVRDESLAPGDAVAVYPDGELDARIGAALARARAALEGAPA